MTKANLDEVRRCQKRSDEILNRVSLPYRVGALMYVPALRGGVGEKLCEGAYTDLNSIAFCLEDAITEAAVPAAEAQLRKTLAYISEHGGDELPLLFVRVRSAAQLEALPKLLEDLTRLLTGVILPKFDLSNADAYFEVMDKINVNKDRPLFVMPILESAAIMSLTTRRQTLLALREIFDRRGDVLNVRVGAMDFCKAYGLRRATAQTIYDIAVVRDVIADILAVFADKYVVSAPVWEYFASEDGGAAWETGMERELQQDMANGFVGKTVIHPSQVRLVEKWLKPTEDDAADARAILNWKDDGYGVAKSITGNRMNEVATHKKWAEKILTLSEIYGERAE